MKSTRLVTRLAVGKDWFPDGISEVVSHTDEHWIAVNVARRVRGKPVVLMREFPCGDRAACHDELRTWLQRLGAECDPDLPAVRDWSERMAGRIVEALVAG